MHGLGLRYGKGYILGSNLPIDMLLGALLRTKFNRKCMVCTSNKMDSKSLDIVPTGMHSLFDQSSTSTN